VIHIGGDDLSSGCSKRTSSERDWEVFS